LSRSGALDRIEALLDGVTDPNFIIVARGEPLSISATPMVAFWLSSREVTFLTFTNASTTTEITIRVYFRMQASQDMRGTTELDVWDAMVNIDTALRSDSNLSDNISDMEIGPCNTGYMEIGGVAYRTMDVILTLEILDEVAITP
tara:strand:+ start:109 stop:543 length:435 start_codon:yes stop_codon:yes gene_type:complete